MLRQPQPQPQPRREAARLPLAETTECRPLHAEAAQNRGARCHDSFRVGEIF